MDDSKKILESINKIKSQIGDTKAKLDTSKRVSIISLASSIFLFVVSIILLILYFTVSPKAKIMMVISIVILVLGFIALQVWIVNKMLVKYVYTEKLKTLIRATDMIKKEIEK